LNLSGVSNLNDIKEIGVQFTAAGSNASGASSIYVDYVTIQ
jgi:mannan endo-1,4-beta-mannosidase